MRPAYFPFYPADFMTGVRGLSPQEVGIYMMLLCRIYEEGGPVEADTARLAAYCGTRPTWFQKALTRLVEMGKIKTNGTSLWNDRALSELAERGRKLEVAARAGKKSAEKRQQFQRETATDVDCPFNHKNIPLSSEPNGSSERAPDGASPPIDFNEAIWTRGVAYLVRSGAKEKSARSLIGRWRKDHGDKAVFEALSGAARAGVADPVAYITRVLRPAGDQKLDAWGIDDAQPVRLEPRAADRGAEAPAGAADLPGM